MAFDVFKKNRPATREQLAAEFSAPGDEAFITQCIEKNLSIGEAWKARATAMQAALDQSRAAEIDNKEEPAAAATAEELESEFPDDPGFVLRCLKSGSTIAQAWKTRAQETNKALAESRASARRVGSAGASGHPGVTHAGGREAAEIVGPGAGSVVAGGGRAERRVASSLPFEIGEEHPYMQEVRRVQAVDGVGYGEAVNRVNKNRPDLAEAYRADKGRAAGRR